MTPKERSKQYYDSMTPEQRQNRCFQSLQWYYANKERILQRQKAYYEKNRIKILNKSQEIRDADPNSRRYMKKKTEYKQREPKAVKAPKVAPKQNKSPIKPLRAKKEICEWVSDKLKEMLDNP